MFKSCLHTLLMMSVSILPVYALQVKALKDNQTMMAKVSAKELSRIFVSGDRIRNVRGLEGAYELKRDDSLGEIYVQPTMYYQHKPFNLFITTEKNHTYNLFLMPLEVPAETIEIKALSPSLKLADRWERNSDYVQTIIELIGDMSNGHYPEGYAVINLGKTKPKKVNSCLTMQLLTLYRGNHLQGESWLLKNKCRTTLSLHPKEFYQDTVRAASIVDETLLPDCETVLYKVVGHD